MVSKFLIYAPAHSSAADLRTKRIFERFETPIPSAIVRTKDPVAIEDPHYDGIREALRAAGARLRPVPVDHEGLDPARLPDDARMVFVTPSHQFPTGAILSFDRRLALLKWARRRNAVIVEDDYDGEFHLRWEAAGVVAGTRSRRPHRLHWDFFTNSVSIAAHRVLDRSSVAGAGVHGCEVAE